MKQLMITALTLAVLLLSASAQQKSVLPQKKKPVTKTAKTPAKNSTAAQPATAAASPNAELEAVLTKLDRAAAGFHAAEADFVWDQFQSIVQEHDLQKGKVFFVRHEKDTHMAADITEPDKKQ